MPKDHGCLWILPKSWHRKRQASWKWLLNHCHCSFSGWALLGPWPPLLFHSSCLTFFPDSTPYFVFWTFMLPSRLAWHLCALTDQEQGLGADSWFPPYPRTWPSQMRGPALGWLQRQSSSFELVNKGGTWFLKVTKSRAWFSRGVQHFKVYKISIRIISFVFRKAFLGG